MIGSHLPITDIRKIHINQSKTDISIKFHDVLKGRRNTTPFRKTH